MAKKVASLARKNDGQVTVSDAINAINEEYRNGNLGNVFIVYVKDDSAHMMAAPDDVSSFTLTGAVHTLLTDYELGD